MVSFITLLCISYTKAVHNSNCQVSEGDHRQKTVRTFSGDKKPAVEGRTVEPVLMSQLERLYLRNTNGFHAFPDKQRAFQETWRVLKPGGDFIACFYIKGKSKRTDWLVENILAKKGWFSPPFQTEEELKDIFQKL